MSVVTDVKNTLTERTAAARKPFYAYAGVVDLAVEQAKGLPDVASKEIADLQAELTRLQSQVVALPDTASKQAGELQTRVKTLRTELEGRVDTYSSKATSLYTELAGRGEKLVAAIRRQESTQAAATTARNTKSHAKGTSTLAKKTTTRTRKATSEGADKIG